MNEPTVAEIVTFRLKPGYSPEKFVTAAAAMTEFLRNTGAMVSRALSTDPKGQWTDHILWTNRPAAEMAAKAVFEQQETMAFIEMIDPTDMDQRHADIQLYLPPE